MKRRMERRESFLRSLGTRVADSPGGCDCPNGTLNIKHAATVKAVNV